MFHNSLISVGELKSLVLSQPAYEVRNGFCDVVVVVLEAWEIRLFAALIEVGSVDKVPWKIVFSTHAWLPNNVGKRSALEKRVLSFLRQVW